MANVPAAVRKATEDRDVVAFYTFGSLANGKLKPLSDLDFGVLLSNALDRKERFEKSIDLLGVFNSTLKTDEVDLVILNDGPLRFAYNIIKTGNLLFCRDRSQLTDFIEKTIKYFLDFRPARDRFDREFLRGIGYHG